MQLLGSVSRHCSGVGWGPGVRRLQQRVGLVRPRGGKYVYRQEGEQQLVPRLHVHTGAADWQAGNMQPPPPMAPAAGGGNPPVFTNFTVYKGRGAMSLKVIRPTWGTLSGGAFTVTRTGIVLLEFASAREGSPASGSGGPQNRTYNWDQKVSIGLNPVELGTLMAEPDKEHALYHDPGKNGPNEGQQVKNLKWVPAEPGKGYYVNVFETIKGPPEVKKSVFVSLTPGEFHIMKVLVNFLIVHILGFDAAVSWDPSGGPPAAGGYAGGFNGPPQGGFPG